MTTITSPRICGTGLNGYGFTWHPMTGEWVGENIDTSGREYDATEADMLDAIAAAEGTLIEGIELVNI